MRTWPLYIVVAGFALGLVGQLWLRGSEQGPTLSVAGGGLRLLAHANQVAANGVVEGRRPEAALRSEVVGVIARVAVKENQEVAEGQLLAELRNESQREQAALAEAEVLTARAERDRVRNGERVEKRRAAVAVESAKEALYRQADSDYKRSKLLGRDRSASTEQQEADYYKMLRTKAEYEQAGAERALAEAAARPDELAAAEGRLAAAEARCRLAKAELAKTRLCAPTAGRILQIHAEPGESAGPLSPLPILLLADLSLLRVRASVEELDVAKVQVGQRALVTADGLPGKELEGKVAVVLSRMGKRAPLSDAPGEYKDLYYREVLIDLAGAPELPINLRVQVRIFTEAEISASANRTEQ